MIDTVNRIYFKQSDYDSLDNMFEALFIQQLALTKNKYMCLVYKSPSNSDVYVLEFASLDPMFNYERVLPCWITAEEAMYIAEDRQVKMQEEMEDVIKESLKIDDEFKGGNNA